MEFIQAEWLSCIVLPHSVFPYLIFSRLLIKKYICAYFAVLGGVDAIIFTAGVGEHAPLIREKSCQGLKRFGIEIDAAKNDAPGSGIGEISTTDSEVKILVLPTNEALKIARETKRAIEGVQDRVCIV